MGKSLQKTSSERDTFQQRVGGSAAGSPSVGQLVWLMVGVEGKGGGAVKLKDDPRYAKYFKVSETIHKYIMLHPCFAHGFLALALSSQLVMCTYVDAVTTFAPSSCRDEDAGRGPRPKGTRISLQCTRVEQQRL